MNDVSILKERISHLDLHGENWALIENDLSPYNRTVEGFELVEPILRLMESHPDFDFGAPGFFVHFVETYYKKGYEGLLIDSLKRAPSLHTLWMLNRILNAVEGEELNEKVSLLRSIANNGSLEKYLRDEAQRFLQDFE